MCGVTISHTNDNNICQKCGYKIWNSHLDNNICQGINIKNEKNGLTSAIKQIKIHNYSIKIKG